MSFDVKQLLQEIGLWEIKNAILLSTDTILFSDTVRKYCERNACGYYGKNWSCPPGVGPLDDLRQQAAQFKQGLLLQTLHYIKDSFDLEGMIAAKKGHDAVIRRVYQLAKEMGIGESLLLGAGFCDLCDVCTYGAGQPCRFPDKALASLEAYGIDVVKLAKDCAIPYHHGSGTVSNVGLILFDKITPR